MRNYTFMAMFIAGALLAACSNDDNEQMDETPVKAEFTATINSLQSRAAGTSWEGTDAIGVTASTIGYANMKYTPTAAGTDQPFTTATPYYFVGTDDATFTAYYPFGGTENTPVGVITKTITADMQTETGQKSIDFLYASATGNRENANIELNFDHKMSNLKLVFKEGYDVTLGKLSYTLSGLKMEGSFNTTNGAIEASGTATDLTISDVEKTNSGDMVSSLILFPQEAQSATLSVTLNGETFTAEMTFPTTASKTGMVSGTTYTYNVTITKSALVISKATINPWTDYKWTGGEGDIDANL